MNRLFALVSVIVVVVGAAWFAFGSPLIVPSQPVGSPVVSPPPQPSSQPGQPITITGTMVCLPHRNTSGPQTMECAYGLLTADGTYYGLRDSDPMYSNIMGLPTGEEVTIMGSFTPRQDSTYQDIGVIEITSVVKK